MIQKLSFMFVSTSLLLLMGSCTSKAPEKKIPYFKGEVEYAYTYESDYLDLDSLKEVKPHMGIFRFDQNNYQSKFYSEVDTTSYYYLSETNTALSRTPDGFGKACLDYGVESDSIIYFNIYETKEKVLYQRCKVIEYKSKSMWNQYLVSKEIKISPKLYKDHVAYNWKFYGEEANGGLILKMEHIYKDYTVKGIATRIKILYKSESALEISEQEIKNICSEREKLRTLSTYIYQ